MKSMKLIAVLLAILLTMAACTSLENSAGNIDPEKTGELLTDVVEIGVDIITLIQRYGEPVEMVAFSADRGADSEMERFYRFDNGVSVYTENRMVVYVASKGGYK